MTILAALLSILCAYLLGSLNFAIIVSRLFFGKDIRKFGSGNAGMTNILRTFGKPAAAGVLTGDVLKGTCAVLLGKLFFALLAPQTGVLLGAYLAATGAILGHLFPLYFGFKGGKGVLVSLGMICVLDWRCALILLGVFLIVLLLSRMVSAASIAAAVSYPIVTYLLYSFFTPPAAEDAITLFGLPLIWFRTLAAALFGVIVIVKHKDNIVRIAKGQEKKFSIKKR